MSCADLPRHPSSIRMRVGRRFGLHARSRKSRASANSDPTSSHSALSRLFRWGWACKPNRHPPPVIGSTLSVFRSKPSRSSFQSSLASGPQTAISASSFAGLSAPSPSTSPRAIAARAVTDRPLLHGCGFHRRVARCTPPCRRVGLRHVQRYPARRRATRSDRIHAASARRSVLSALGSASDSASESVCR